MGSAQRTDERYTRIGAHLCRGPALDSLALETSLWLIPHRSEHRFLVMSSKLSDIFRNVLRRDAVASTVRSYERDFGSDEAGSVERRKAHYRHLINQYYDLVTDFYEYGWGKSFHFAPRAPNESFPESLARHERNLAQRLALRPGMRVADLGCGVGGPLREIARFSGATIVGVNNNEYQLERARTLTDEAGLGHLAEFCKCDFMHMDAPDESFDAAFSVEGTPHAPSKIGCYGEVFRVLKPGACFAAYEYCLTGRFDPSNPRHQQVKSDLEVGGALPDIPFPHQIDDALRQVGFELLETGDLAESAGPGIPWYQPLVGSRFSFAGFRSSKAGRMETHGTLQLLEALRIVPEGTVRVSGLLNLCATAMVASGRLGIFTPMYFVYARKPQ